MSVTSGANSGPGTLRELVENSAVNTITVSPSVTTITLSSRLILPRDIEIIGNGVTITYTNGATITGGALFQYASLINVSFDNIDFVGNLVNSNNIHILGPQTTGFRLASLSMTSCTCINLRTNVGLIIANDTNIFLNDILFQDLQVANIIVSSRDTTILGPFSIVIENCQVIGSTLSNAGFIITSSGTPTGTHQASLTLRNTIFEENIYSGSNNLIFVTGAAVNSITMENIIIRNNTASAQILGITITGAPRGFFRMNDIVIEDNIAGSSAPIGTEIMGIRVTSTSTTGLSGELILNNISVRNNTTRQHVGVYLALATGTGQTQQVFLNNVSIVENTVMVALQPAPQAPLVLTGALTTYNLNNVVVAGNRFGTVGGIDMAGTSTKTLRNVTVAYNVVGFSVGGVRVGSGTPPPSYVQYTHS